jgi:hypothetical protein
MVMQHILKEKTKQLTLFPTTDNKGLKQEVSSADV